MKKYGIQFENMQKVCFLLLLETIAFSTFAQAQEMKKGELLRMAYPIETPGWINFYPENGIDPINVFELYKLDFDLSEKDKIVLVSKKTDQIGIVHYSYQQFYNSIKVIGGEYYLHEKNGHVISMNGKLMIRNKPKEQLIISEEGALEIAKNEIASKDYFWLEPELEKEIKRRNKDENATYFPFGELVYMKASKSISKNEEYFLCWKFNINVTPIDQSHTLFVDVENGKIINKIPLTLNCSQGTGTTLWNGSKLLFTKQVINYTLVDDCQATIIHTRNGNGSNNGIGWSDYFDSDNIWSNGANQQYQSTAHWAVKQTYLYYLNTFSYEGYNNTLPSQPMISYLNPGFVGNANWSTGTQSVFFGGNADGTNPYITLDVGGHEHTHGLIEKNANLVYSYESGALNESLADIFGEMVELYTLGSCDWVHREEINNGNRSFLNPKNKNQPDTYLTGVNWYSGSDDNGGVHTNSGVQNYWFYLLSIGDTGTNDNGQSYSVTGIGATDASNIVFYALTQNLLTSSSQFIDARAAMIQASNFLYGNCSNQSIQVANAWYAVGVGAQSPEFNKTVCGNLNGNYYAINSIENNCPSSVNNGIVTNMSAKSSVILKPPFFAYNGSTFRAYLGEPCALTSYKLNQEGVESDGEASEWLNKVEEMDFIAVVPNPFSENAKIVFNLTSDSGIELSIYNLQMQILRRVESNSSFKAGRHEMNLDASDFAAGIYICRLKEKDKSHFTRFVLNK